jgi:hypothetical protein
LAAICAHFASLTPDDCMLPCVVCGRRGTSWCNTCERKGNCPFPNWPNRVTPLCHACENSDQQCRICGTRPSGGPSEMEMLLSACGPTAEPVAEPAAEPAAEPTAEPAAQPAATEEQLADIAACYLWAARAVQRNWRMLQLRRRIARRCTLESRNRLVASITSAVIQVVGVPEPVVHTIVDALVWKPATAASECRLFVAAHHDLRCWLRWHSKLWSVHSELRHRRRRCACCRLAWSTKTCSLCGVPRYCSRECQKRHWRSEHRRVCPGHVHIMWCG